MWKRRGCCFDKWPPRGGRKTGLIGLSIAPYPLYRISRVTLCWPHSSSWALSPVMGHVQFIIGSLAPVTELKVWHSSLGNVLQLLHRSIFVCVCTLGIVLDLFWCRVMTAFQRLLLTSPHEQNITGTQPSSISLLGRQFSEITQL